MAKIVLNSAFRHLSGEMDGWVYKQYRHGTVVSRRPRMENVQWSPAQIAHRQRVRAAAEFYRTVSADPKLKKKYAAIAARKNLSLYAATLSEFLKGPNAAG